MPAAPASPPPVGRALGGLVALAVAVGVVARFTTSSPLWLDEALTVDIARLPLSEIGPALRRDGHPPLYYWLLHGWTTLFGTGDLAVRALSGVLSVASLPLAWVVGRRRGGPELGAWAVVLVALCPFCVRYATEARMYALVMALVLAGAVLVDDVVARGGRAAGAGLAAVTAALLWTHYWSLHLVAVVAALLVLRAVRVPGDRAGARRALVALGVGALAFLPWVPALADQLAHTGTPWAPPSRPAQVLAVTLDDLGGGGWAEARLLGVLSVVLALVGLCGTQTGATVVLGPRTRPALRPLAAVAAGTLALGSLVALAGSSAYASRYAAVVVPLALVVVAAGLVALPRGWPVALAAGAWIVLAGIGIGHNATVERTQADELAGRIAEDGGEPVVVVCPDQLGPSLDRALAARGVAAEVLAYPTLDDGRFVDWRDYRARNDAADPAERAAEILDRAGGRDLWLVWSGAYRTFEGDCEALAHALGSARPPEIVHGPADLFESAALQLHPAPA
ncbi:MAG: glycosyltransferase family 39 protein [Acidimicrobiia bacterium]